MLELLDETGARRVAGSWTGGTDGGELVVTTLDIPSRPLLRYRTGDLVEIDYAPCPCGVRTPVLRTRGRAQDVLVLSGSGIRQDDLEAALWDEPLPGTTIFNYMLVVRGRGVVCLVTTDRAPEDGWTTHVTDRLRPLFDGYDVAVRPVKKLPPLASLGQYLGWKLSRVLDLNDERNWARLPEPIHSIVKATLAEVQSAVRS